MDIMHLQDAIIDSIVAVINTMLEKLKFNRTEYGKVTSILGNYQYGVTINELESKIYAIDNKIFVVGDVVIIIIGNNSFNTDKYILAKRPF